MKAAGMIIISCLLVLGLSAAGAEATSITFNLDGVISGSGYTAASSSFGTVILTDNGNFVNIDVELANPSWKILEMGLNYDDAKFSNHSAFSLNNESLTVSENAVKQDGYKGKFDIDIPGHGNIGTYGSYTGILKLNNGSTDINAADFDFMDTASRVFASLHIGNYEGNSSIWVGASLDTTPSPSQVPEPAVIFLLGTGMLGLFVLRRKFALSPKRY